MTIGPASEDDFTAIVDLLAQNGLPVAGLAEHLATTLVARQDGRLVASAALEIYRDGALLRSVAVTPALQGRGLGHALTEAALALARDRGVTTVYLLTTTAENFFPRLGFTRITRNDVPETVRGSVEFTSACPSSATAMRKML